MAKLNYIRVMVECKHAQLTRERNPLTLAAVPARREVRERVDMTIAQPDFYFTAGWQAAIGAILLLFGRKVYWLLISAAGLIAGLWTATYIWGQPNNWPVLLIALGFALAGALACLFVQRIAISLAGFVAGAYIATTLFFADPSALDAGGWIVFLAGGIFGAVLVQFLFGWALICLSSILGALLLAQAATHAPLAQNLLFVVLLVTGLGFQFSWNRKPTKVASS